MLIILLLFLLIGVILFREEIKGLIALGIACIILYNVYLWLKPYKEIIIIATVFGAMLALAIYLIKSENKKFAANEEQMLQQIHENEVSKEEYVEVYEKSGFTVRDKRAHKINR